MKLKDKVAIVTGGGTGMGRATCERFAREGARVVVNYSRSRQAAEEVADGIRRQGGDAIAVEADVAVDAQVREMISRTGERWGRLDILVNNAGWTRRTPHHRLEDLTDEIWDRTLNVNLRGPFYTMRAALPLLKKNPGSAIVNVATTAFFTGSGSTIAYGAAKSALIAMTKSFAKLLAPEGRANVMAPGTVATGFAGWPPEFYENIAKQSPLKRIATTDEVASAILFLVADATFMTGETLLVDCGAISLGGGF
ncbi:MAG TPA: SDR family oxidoreductase [Gemmatimonadales bacterium]|nr:SDR family oxidoreductase [Gemmatimonadales bacterium]